MWFATPVIAYTQISWLKDRGLRAVKHDIKFGIKIRDMPVFKVVDNPDHEGNKIYHAEHGVDQRGVLSTNVEIYSVAILHIILLHLCVCAQPIGAYRLPQARHSIK